MAKLVMETTTPHSMVKAVEDLVGDYPSITEVDVEVHGSGVEPGVDLYSELAECERRLPKVKIHMSSVGQMT